MTEDWSIPVGLAVCIDETDTYTINGYDILTRQQLTEALYVRFYGATGTKSTIQLGRVNSQPQHVTLYFRIDSRIFFDRMRACGTEAFKLPWFNCTEKYCQLLVMMKGELHLFMRPCSLITRLESEPTHPIHKARAEHNQFCDDMGFDIIRNDDTDSEDFEYISNADVG